MRLGLAVPFFYITVVSAQVPSPAPTPPAARSEFKPSPLFQVDSPLVLQITTDLKALLRDRGQKRVEHGATLRFSDLADTGTIKVDLRTRGIFRLKECGFPPIRIDFPAKKVSKTPFAHQDKLKLVTHCMSGRSYERNLLKEYAVYRVFRALTDTSFRVRLAHVTYLDSARTDTLTRYAFLIESDAELARRLGAESFEGNNVHDLLTDPAYMTLVAMFQYLIGNTDWSVWGRHNIALMRRTTGPPPQTIFAVPYDYDFSGAVGAPYATPPAQLPIRTVRERYYRGFCQPDSILQTVLQRFRTAKDSIYAAVRSVTQLPEGDRRGLLSYFDEFYNAIENRSVVQREFVRGCRSVPQ
jgi:hypothetical protein